jgi:hypothetical protein
MRAVLDVEKRKGIIGSYQLHEKDTGSPEVQIALLSARIEYRRSISRPKEGSSFPAGASQDGSASGAGSGLHEKEGRGTLQKR